MSTTAPSPKPAARSARGPLLLLAGFVALNLLLMAGYRAAFIGRFAAGFAPGQALCTAVAGARLDLALLGCEAAIVLAAHLGARRLGGRSLCLVLWTASVLNALAALANYVLFAERSQHLGELLAAYITEPLQAWLAVAPFIAQRPLLTLAIAATLTLALAAGWRASRRCADAGTALRPAWPRLPLLALAATGALAVTCDPVAVKRTVARGGYRLELAHSASYVCTTNAALNQAVSNPLYDLLRIHLPAALKPQVPRHLPADAALRRGRDLLALPPPLDPAYPLLQAVASDLDLGLRNVIILQVEGLSAGLVHHRVDGRPVMPGLERLAATGLWFPDTWQSANATAGALFATVTSCHKATFDERTRRFASYEMNGWYGSLPRLLGIPAERSLFCQGFRQSAPDFLTFMRNQGFTPVGYREIHARLRGRGTLAGAEDVLGIHDGPLLSECAALLRETQEPFVAHILTATTHSPWSVPSAAPRPFADAGLNAFAYADAAIAAFLGGLGERPGLLDRTLVVIVGDHTSLLQDRDPLGPLRVALLFWSPAMAGGGSPVRGRHDPARRASQVDVLPTILSLLGGRHLYAGFGRDLLHAPPAGGPGPISVTNSEGYYARGTDILVLRPFDPVRERLLADSRQGLSGRVPRPAEAARVETLRDDYAALAESAARLAASRRVYPATSRPTPPPLRAGSTPNSRP